MMIKSIAPKTSEKIHSASGLVFREPVSRDGASLHGLVASCPPLDANSMYCNLLQCTHFAGTSIAACDGDRLVGFISGYLLPDASQTLFVWQVAVAPSARKQGLARRMLLALLARPMCASVVFMHTSVTPENTASLALFASLARELQAPLSKSTLFARDDHFNGQHADEMLMRIGPIQPRNAC